MRRRNKQREKIWKVQQIKLGPTFFEKLRNYKFQIGELIYIETLTDSLKWVGRCNVYAEELDLKKEEYTYSPKENLTKEENSTKFTLQNLDIVDARL